MASRANELLLCPENKSRYDSADIKSIFEYAKQLEGKTFEDILRDNGLSEADNGVFHIRNHASKSFYVINGVSYGNGTLSDTDELPNGDRITKQAYWLNRSYIESQLRSDLVMQYD